MKSKGAIYARVSTEEQAKDGYSIEAQINTLKAYGQIYGIDIVKIYKDEGLSGKNIDRPQLQQMLSDAKERMFDMVLVWKISRLSRNLKNLLSIVDMLDSLNISFISQSETFNTLTPVGRMTLQILGSIAEFERNTIIENIKLGLGEKAKKGEWLGGRVFGYKNIDKKLVIDEEKAIIVRDIFERYNNGLTLAEIVEYLKNLGIRTINNKTFTAEAIRRILKNPIYTGMLRHRKDRSSSMIKGIHMPIITNEMFEKANQRQKNNKIKKTEITTQNLLIGLLKCPICNSNMVGYQSNLYRYYRCGKYHNYGKSVCRGVLVNAEKIESEALQKVKSLLKKSKIRKQLYDSLRIDEIFKENFDEDFISLKAEDIAKILKEVILEITIDGSKNIKNIILKNMI